MSPAVRAMPILTARRVGGKWVAFNADGSLSAAVEPSPSDTVLRARAKAAFADVRFER